MRRLINIAATILLAAPCLAAEGKWTPEQILHLDAEMLAEAGLEIPPRALWYPGEGGLLEAAVDFGGCSAGFVSAEGLLITNHHCALGVIQRHSRPDRNLLAEGFLAPTREAELPGEGLRVRIPHRFTDVTREMLAAVPAGADDLVRYRALEKKEKELVAACEATPNRRCRVAAYHGGLRFTLEESLEFPDVRLVWAPPESVGNYGGEVDNWSWPRHTGDVALLRVWAGGDNQPAPFAPENQPYRPRQFFRVATTGVQPGSFVMAVGYPGRTFRELTAPEMAERAERFFPARAAVFRDWIKILSAAAERSEAARIALAPALRDLANGEKNARGQLAGLARGRILEAKKNFDAEVQAWARQQKGYAGAVEAYATLEAMVAEKLATFERDFLLASVPRYGPRALAWALTLARWTEEKAKPDLERQPAYMERNRERLRTELENAQKRFDPAGDAALLADLLHRLAALPEGQRSPAVEAFVGQDRARPAITRQVEGLLAATKVTDLGQRLAMFDGDRAALTARNDPLLRLAVALDGELRALEEREHRWAGTAYRARPQWIRAANSYMGVPVAPDANGSLRFTWGHVKGYSPRDAVWLEPATRLAGLLEKHTGEEPFAAPQALRKAAAAAGGSRWADPRLGDVPVNFLADLDTTGGNSGSPVLNGRGELVGVNFDRVWENVANDFGYNPEVARNVSVDVRYIFWVMETLHGVAASPLLAELGLPPATPR